MAVVITPFPHQRIPISTPFSLNIPVSGNPSNISLGGRLIGGLTYNWNAAQSRIELRGSPEDLVENVEVTIIADDVRQTGFISVMPIAPVIGNLPRVVVQRGVEVLIPIPISGNPSRLVVAGPWIGLRNRLVDTGGEFYGVVPADIEFTTRRFDFSITAYIGSVFDTAIQEIEIGLGS